MLRTLSLALAAASMALPAAPALAWGPIGHRVAAAIAQDNVDGRTRAAIAQILGDETLSEASTWPDEQRSNPAQFWQETASPYHYVTLAPGTAAEDIAHPAEGDALTALERFRAVLRDPAASQEDKALALRFVVHIVSDLHMPLHAGKPGDRGGNDVVADWFGTRTNLHWIWDEGMILRQQLSFSEYAERLDRRIAPEETLAWWNARPETWIDESAALRDRLYPETGAELGMGTAEAPVRIGNRYQWQWLPVAEERLQQAGVRLAAYLDATFAPSGGS